VSKNYTVHRAKSYDSRWSDHSPVTVVYAIEGEHTKAQSSKRNAALG